MPAFALWIMTATGTSRLVLSATRALWRLQYGPDGFDVLYGATQALVADVYTF